MIDHRFLDLAIRLGDRGLGRTGANPSVGCVLVRDGQIIGVGHTSEGGRPHAERVALAQAGNAKGSDAYVTLEPCAHHGQTSPCANALIEAGIARVICPIQDPDPRVGGKGFAMLRDAGIKVVHPKINKIPAGLKPFLFAKSLGRTMITLKSATTIDGKIALANGKSQWITCEETRKVTRAMRAQFDAIIVGIGTVIADNPSLNVRTIGLESHAPRPVILDTHCRTPIDAKLFEISKPILFHGENSQPSEELKAKAECMATPLENNTVSIEFVATRLAKLGFNSALIEGGAKLAVSALKADVVDQIIHVSASKLIGADGISAIGNLELESMVSLPQFTRTHLQTIGDDVLSFYDSRRLNISDFYPT